MALDQHTTDLATRVALEINTVRSEMAAPATGGGLFIFAMEENSNLNPGTNNGYQFSVGNGSTNAQGATLPFSCIARGLSIRTRDDATGVVELYKNGLATGETITLTAAKSTFRDDLNIVFNAGDAPTFRTISGSGGGQVVVTVALATDGVQGASAYQIWLDEGNSGTEADFLTSVVGATGVPGAEGPGIPTGGTTGQVPVKRSNSDFDLVWDDVDNGDGLTKISEDLTPQLGANLDTNGNSITNALGDLYVNSSTGKVNIHGAANLFALNVKGTGLNARMSFQGDPGSNPGVQLQNDTTGDRRSLIRMNEAGAFGTELAFYTRPDTGGAISENFVMRSNGNLDVTGLINGRDIVADGTVLDALSGAQANVQSDWNTASGDAFIKNKPTGLSAFTNDGSYLVDAPADGSAYIRKNGTWIVNANGDGIVDAPSDGIAYIRKDGDWAENTGVAPTKAQIESALTGVIASHSHPGAPQDGKIYGQLNGVWAVIGEMPVGGSSGQYMVKNSNTNFDISWVDGPSRGDPNFVGQNTTPTVVANGVNSIAAGHGSSANSDSSIALGNFAVTSGVGSICLGAGASSGERSIAMGDEAHANVNSIALGSGAYAPGPNGIALGVGANIDGSSSIAIGENAIVEGNHSIAIGKDSSVNENHSAAVAIGHGASTTTEKQIVLGQTGANAPTVRIPKYAGNGTGIVALDNNGDLSWAATPSGAEPSESFTNNGTGNFLILDGAGNSAIQHVMNAHTTMSSANVSDSGKVYSFVVRLLQDATGSWDVKLPENTTWAYGEKPVFPTIPNSMCKFTLETWDNGSSWEASWIGSDYG